MAGIPSRAKAQQDTPSQDWEELLRVPAVSGYEQELAAQIRQKLNSFSPRTDNLGNLYITLGSGAPHKLLVTPIDEPGYVISGITSDGYLRVQRVPQAPPNPVFDLLHSAQPVWVITRTGKRVPGVFAGLSVHLQTLRLNMPKMSHPDEMYVDVGASSTEEVHAAGVELLDPVALTDLFTELRLDKAKLRGTVTVAFVTQQWTGGRGLERLLREVHPDEMISVGRLLQARPAGGAPASSRVQPGTGILLGVADPSAPLSGLGLELEKQSDRAHRRLNVQAALAPRIAGYTTPTGFPERFAQLSLPVLFPVTPAETVSMRDVGELTELLFQYAAGAAPMGGLGGGHGGGCGDCGPPLLPDLVETYGASGHEDAVRKKVQAWLNPKYSPKKKVETRIDTAGNLILHLGDAKPEAKTPKILFVAHMDEIGYQVRSLEPDGRLLVDVLGGGYTGDFLGHVVVVQKGDGTTSGGVLELPEGWDRPGFEWPHGPRGLDEPAHVYVGTRS